MIGVYLTYQLDKEINMEQAFNADTSPLAMWLKEYNKELAVFKEVRAPFRASCKRLNELTGWDVRKMESHTSLSGA